LSTQLGVTTDESIVETCVQWGGNMGIHWLKNLYKRHLSMFNALEDSTDPEEEEELHQIGSIV